MRIVVTGSVANDHLMSFSGRFQDQLISEKLDRVSLSFLVDELTVHRGGVAANITFGLGCLGASPVLVAAVGNDFDDYEAWLRDHGVDTRHVARSAAKPTARFLCTTDSEQNQIASFYSGAMAEAKAIDLAPVLDRLAAPVLVLISSDDPEAMLRHAELCRARGYPFAADPSQQLASMGEAEVRAFIDGARYLFTNEYEAALLLKKAGYLRDEVLARTSVWITTLGGAGVRIEGQDIDDITVPAVPAELATDPTGAGDGFRAGFLYGRSCRLGLERSAQLGCLLAAIVLEAPGPQEYEVRRSNFADRAASAYGGAAAAEIESVLRTQEGRYAEDLLDLS